MDASWKIVAAALAVLTVVGLLLGIIVDLMSASSVIRGWFRRRRAKNTLHQFAAGRWRSMGESNELVIERDRDLTWRWTSTWQGRWRGDGHGEVRGENLVLHGSRDGFDALGKRHPRHPITITLERHDDRLEGSIEAMLKSGVIFVRDELARAEW
jgi:hypothetical protein